MGSNWNLIHSWYQSKLLWEKVWQYLLKLNTYITYNPTVLLLDIFLREVCSCVNQKSCRRMFITAVFITAPTGKYPNPINKRKDK